MSTCERLTEQIWHIHKIGYFVAFSTAEAQTHTWKDCQGMDLGRASQLQNMYNL